MTFKDFLIQHGCTEFRKDSIVLNGKVFRMKESILNQKIYTSDNLNEILPINPNQKVKVEF